MGKNRGKRSFLWLTVTVLVGLSIWGIYELATAPADQGGVIIDSVSANDWIDGNQESQTILIEYGDFQCPACGSYHPLIEQLLAEHGNEFKFVYRHFPLAQHLHARDAAYAAEAAGQQGKFWEMHDLLFERQSAWSTATKARIKDIFREYAQTLNLDLGQFDTDRADSATIKRVQSDYSSGLNNQVSATPTFFLNGKKISPTSYQAFAELIQSAHVSPTPNPTPTPTP